MSNSLFICCLIIAWLNFISCANQEPANNISIKCNAAEKRKLDAYFALLTTFGDAKRLFPNNNEEMLPFCDENRFYHRWGTAYQTKCLRDTSRYVFGLALNKVRILIKKYCRQNSKPWKKFLEMGQCGNKGKRGVLTCFRKYIHDLQFIKDLDDYKVKMPLVCCHFHKFYLCAEDKLRDIQDQEEASSSSSRNVSCNESNIEEFMRIIFESTEEVVDYLCPLDYKDRESNKCDAVIKKNPTVVFKGTLPTSPIATIIDVIDSIPS